MADAPLIDIHNATIYRGETRVFEGFSVSIGQHEQAAILGPNGSGKTTLLKIINREIYPVRQDDSWVRILGRETWNVWDLRSHIGIVSHELQMRYRNTTTGLDVVLSGYLSSVGIRGLLAKQLTSEQKDHAISIMGELGIESLADTPLRKMSTGQQRRCLLGRALVHNPDTLILDEPTAGLDLSASFDYLARIRSQIGSGKSIVLVTHLLNEIPPDIQRLILLREGRIVADGPKEEVLTEENLKKTYDTDVRIASGNPVDIENVTEYDALYPHRYYSQLLCVDFSPTRFPPQPP
jgi:iron complex transport system ATP-binding protein